MFLKDTYTILKKELYAYFATPIAYVYITFFLILSGVATYYFGNFFQRGQADLVPFFSYLPWVFLVFLPAVSMRLFSEEKRIGTIELLFTLPIKLSSIVLGKFLAALVFVGISLLLTTVQVAIVNYLGSPDNFIILSSYLGTLLLAATYLSIGSFISACTKNQVVAFILTVIVCLALNLSSYPVVVETMSKLFPEFIVTAIANFDWLGHFDVITKGLFEVKTLFLFLSTISAFLLLNIYVLDTKA